MREIEAYIYIENDIFLKAKAFGKRGTYCSKMNFKTSVFDYEDIITNHENANQFIVFTMPEIGVAGVNGEDLKSKNIQVYGIIIRKLNDHPSNFKSKGTLKEWFERENKIGIYDIDTRYLTNLLRDNKDLKVVISTEIKEKNELKKYLDNIK